MTVGMRPSEGGGGTGGQRWPGKLGTSGCGRDPRTQLDELWPFKVLGVYGAEGFGPLAGMHEGGVICAGWGVVLGKTGLQDCEEGGKVKRSN